MVDQANIKKQISDLIDATSKMSLEASKEAYATGMANIIFQAITSGEVIVAPGIPVQTAGSAIAQTGATTAPGTGVIK